MKPSRVRQALLPFTLVYAAGVRFKNIAYDRRLVQPARLSWPVVSVGNLSVGGAGKTSMVLLLARLLAERGWAVDVLSRGYGRSSKRVLRVDPNGRPADFGDEPLLMARRGLPVYVGAARYPAGLAAENSGAADQTKPRLHILDDGFQHRKLARTVDIVLLQRSDLEGDMLPMGRLREPLAALERADICVLRSEDADLTQRVLRLMRADDPARVWRIDRRTFLAGPIAPASRALAFCALGDAQGFFDGLRRVGLDVPTQIAFRDHHAYTARDMERIQRAARARGADCCVTTEKDSVRLSPDLRQLLEQELPLKIAGLDVSLLEESRAMAILEELIASKLQVLRGNVR
ncbi:MAG: tetraacyldisaccharide 4'-kinase [Acidobacteriaceae bacterium]